MRSISYAPLTTTSSICAKRSLIPNRLASSVVFCISASSASRSALQASIVFWRGGGCFGSGISCLRSAVLILSTNVLRRFLSRSLTWGMSRSMSAVKTTSFGLRPSSFTINGTIFCLNLSNLVLASVRLSRSIICSCRLFGSAPGLSCNRLMSFLLTLSACPAFVLSGWALVRRMRDSTISFSPRVKFSHVPG